MSSSKYYYWQCLHCGNVHRSDKTKRHQMDFCECNQSAIDAEELYVRSVGDTKQITEIEYNVVLEEQNKNKNA